jgi:hypothetical protein
MLLSKIKVAMAMVLVVLTLGVGGVQVLVPTQAAARADEPKQAQPDKAQSPPQKDEPRILILEKPDGVLRQHCLFVRDPSSGEWKPLTREDGIPVLKGHIEVGVKKLKEAKDDKSIREALRGLEESVRNMKDLLSLPGAPAEKKPGDNKPAKEHLPFEHGAAIDSDEDAKPRELPVAFADSDIKIGLRLPPPDETTLPLDKVADRLGLAGELAKINAVNVRDLRAQLIRIVRDYLERDLRTLYEAKDEKSIREALKGLEESVRNMKDLLSLPGAPAEKKPEDKKLKRWKAPLHLGDGEIPVEWPVVEWFLWQEMPPVKQLGRFDELKTYSREEAIPIFKNYVALAAKKVKEAKDEKSMREALEGLERSVQMLKELLSFGTPAEKNHGLSEILTNLNFEKSAPKK